MPRKKTAKKKTRKPAAADVPLTAAGLKKLRLAKGWTQEQLASHLGVRMMTVSRYERGFRPISLTVSKHIRLLAKAGALVLLVVTLGACGGSSSPTTPTVAPAPTPRPLADRAVVVLTTDPSPILAEETVGRCRDLGFPWLVQWDAVFDETANLGANIDFVRFDFRTPSGSMPPGSALEQGADEIIEDVGTNHIEPLGELRVPLGMCYRASSGRTITVITTAQLHDDKGNLLTVVSEAEALFRKVAEL